MQAQLDTVYDFVISGEARVWPTVSVTGGTVNMHLSNKPNRPANAAAMEVLDSGSPLGDGSVNTIVGDVRWICFAAASGSPTVYVRGAELETE